MSPPTKTIVFSDLYAVITYEQYFCVFYGHIEKNPMNMSCQEFVHHIICVYN